MVLAAAADPSVPKRSLVLSSSSFMTFGFFPAVGTRRPISPKALAASLPEAFTTALTISLGVFPTFGASAITYLSPATSDAGPLFAADLTDRPGDAPLRELI